jgi:hypothetical protein
MNAKPNTTTITPATMERRRWSWTSPPAAPANAPSATKTSVKPAMKGMLAATTFLPPTPICTPRPLRDSRARAEHAGSHEGQEARDERERDFRVHD